MPAARAGRPGQVGVQVDPDRAGQVTGQVVVAQPGRPPSRQRTSSSSGGAGRSSSAARASASTSGERVSRPAAAARRRPGRTAARPPPGPRRPHHRVRDRRHPAHVVPAAEHLVADAVAGVGVADHDLLALDDHHPVDGPGVVGGPGAAPAERLDLQHLDPVGQLDQPLRAREQPGPEVGGDAEREHVDAELVDHPGQLLGVHRRVELHLVADQVVDPAAAHPLVGHDVPEVQLVGDLDRRRGQARAGWTGWTTRPGPAG